MEKTGDWAGVAKAAVWPLFALILIGIFFQPLSGLLRNTSNSDMVVEQLEVGTLKLKLSPSGVARLPAPDPALASRLAQLGPGEIEELISWPPGVIGASSCLKPLPPGDRGWEPLVRSYQEKRVRDWQRELKLKDLQLYHMEPNDRYGTGTGCDQGAYVTMTEDGKKAREFLLQLAANAIHLSAK